jgi:hypothetical protein
MTGLLEVAVLAGGLPRCVHVARAPLGVDWRSDVVAAVAPAGARVVDRVSSVVVGVQVVVGGARRRVRVAAMARTGRAVRVVSQEEVVVGVARVLGPRAAEQIARGELVEREQHVVDDRVSHVAALGEGKVVRVAEGIVLGVVRRWVYGRGIVEERLLLGLVGVEGSHGPVRPVCSRRGSGCGGTAMVVGVLGHGGLRGMGVSVCVECSSRLGRRSILRKAQSAQRSLYRRN